METTPTRTHKSSINAGICRAAVSFLTRRLRRLLRFPRETRLPRDSNYGAGQLGSPSRSVRQNCGALDIRWGHRESVMADQISSREIRKSFVTAQ